MLLWIQGFIYKILMFMLYFKVKLEYFCIRKMHLTSLSLLVCIFLHSILHKLASKFDFKKKSSYYSALAIFVAFQAHV